MEPTENYDFGRALAKLKRGARVQRDGWNGKGMWLGLCAGLRINLACDRGEDRDTLPFIVMKTVTGHYVPWLASQTDVLASDWRDVP